MDTMESMDSIHRRLDDPADFDEANTTEIIKNTFRVYGLLFLVLFSLFCYVRQRYPNTYNVRNVVESLNCKLAEKAHPHISWMWKVFYATDDEIFEQCGMDAVSFIRILSFGMKVSVVGVFNSFYLMPIYGSAPKDTTTMYITDKMQLVTLGNLPESSPRFVATVFAAYIVFGYTMYLILQELEWYTKNRHRFLSRMEPENYSVYISHIPEKMQSSSELLDYFRNCFSPAAVLDAKLALEVPELEKKVAAREALVAKLEHAINIQEVKGTTPTHRDIMQGGVQVESIPAYSEELKNLNEEISKALDDIDAAQNHKSYADDLESAKKSSAAYMAAHPSMRNVEAVEEEPTESELQDAESEGKKSGGLFDVSGHLLDFSSHVMKKGMTMLVGNGDGAPRSAGFVTFKNLKTTQAALQMIHHATPFAMTAQTAPAPEDVFWKNVGLSNKSLQIGRLLGLGLTILLCLFWTIPVSFVGTLTEVNSLKEMLPFLEDWVEKQPWIEQLLAQLAPVFLMILISLLPVILIEFAKLEGHIGESVLQASLFSKLSVFMIIQTFFVTAISGSIAKELEKMVDDPSSIIELMATALPAQSAFFMQLLLVQTFLGMGLELLRVVDVAIAAVRGCVGPNLTEKERNTTWMGLRPLSDPKEFEHAQVLGEMILYYMVTFVYSVMAPMTAYVLLFNFFVLSMAYRNQFIYVYPPRPDSGGLIWIRFIKVITGAMLIAEFTLVGVFALKQSAIGTPLFVPLIVVQLLFNQYISQKHYYVTNHLPSYDAIKKDLANKTNQTEIKAFKGAYVQPALQTRTLQPENLGAEREMQLERLNYYTPPGSEADEEEFALSDIKVE